MGEYGEAAEFYDLLYAKGKDYPREAEVVAGLIRARHADARSILDVGCGTGAHARALLEHGFEVTGVDIEPAFVEMARAKCPNGTFETEDMRTLDLGRRFDAVVCLFSAIGYACTIEGLTQSLIAMASHLTDAGVLVVDPWFAPNEMTDGHIVTTTGSGDGVDVVRMSRTVIEGSVSTLEFEYLVGTSTGIERRSERHRLGLFTEAEMVSAFSAAGLDVERIPKTLRMRGVYVGSFR